MDPDKKTPIKKMFLELNFENIFVWLIILLCVLLIINIVLTFNINKDLAKKAEGTKEKINPCKN